MSTPQENALGECRRCGGQAIIVVRNDPLCSDDFVSYIQTKINKRLEGFRVRDSLPGAPRKILLPLSLGVSSLTLLRVLDQQSKRQIARTGRSGYVIHVLHVLSQDQTRHKASRALFDEIQARFPVHSYTLKTMEDSDPSPETRPATSATSQADLAQLRRTQLIVETAKEAGCQVICWGDSTTRLAEKILAETAKGRGFALPWLVNDGETPFGVNFSFPVRDVLKKELHPFSSLASPPFSDLLAEDAEKKSTSISSKNTTIDSLMTEYFATVEQNFPSIVANVVRTSGKLSTPAKDTHAVVCDSCMMPLHADHSSLYAWGGQQTTADATEEIADVNSGGNLCYACARALRD